MTRHYPTIYLRRHNAHALHHQIDEKEEGKGFYCYRRMCEQKEKENMSSKEYMYFDTRDNYVPPEQVRKT